MVGDVLNADVMCLSHWFSSVSRILRYVGEAFSKISEEYSMIGLIVDV